MKTVDSLQTARQAAKDARRDYEAQRVKRLASIPITALAAPKVDSIADTSDGTLLASVIDDNLEVNIDAWLNRSDFDTVQLMVKKVDRFEAAGPVVNVDTSTPFPLTVTLPKAWLEQEPTFDLIYEQINGDSGNPSRSDPLRLRVDRTPPWRNQNPPAMLLPTVPINDKYLIDNPAGVVGEIPEYADRKPNDKIAYYYLNQLPPSDPADLPNPIGFIAVPNDRKVTIPADEIRKLGDGGCYVVYVLFDVAGNVSHLSVYTALGVALGAEPSGMLDPVVPLAVDGLIDLEDARTGVAVNIPAFLNWKATDTLKVTWGTSTLAAEQMGSSPVFPYPVIVPPAVLQAEYTAATGSQTTTVSYELFRGTVSFGVFSTEVEVDFSVIGPGRPDPDPDWPGGNPTLARLEVRGKVSNVANTLTRADEKQPATVTLKRYANAKDGELIRFYWKGVHVTEADITVDTSASEDLTADIPWSYIYAARNDPALPVHYAIIAPGGVNEDLSPTTEVNADAVALRAPPVKFERTFVRGDGSEILNCSSLWDKENPDPANPAFLVTTPDLTELGVAAGHVLKITWTAFKGLTGDTEVGKPKTADLEIGKDLPITGGSWEIKPYADHIQPIYDGSTMGRGRVTFVIKGGTEDIPSDAAELPVALYTGSGSCEIPPGP